MEEAKAQKKNRRRAQRIEVAVGDGSVELVVRVDLLESNSSDRAAVLDLVSVFEKWGETMGAAHSEESRGLG